VKSQLKPVPSRKPSATGVSFRCTIASSQQTASRVVRRGHDGLRRGSLRGCAASANQKAGIGVCLGFELVPRNLVIDAAQPKHII